MDVDRTSSVPGPAGVVLVLGSSLTTSDLGTMLSLVLVQLYR